MDGDPVNGEPSNGTGVGDDDAPITTFTEAFIKLFPSFMVKGMTYQQYWHGPAWLAKSFTEAYEMNRKNEEWERHRQGLYFLQSLKVALSGFSKDKSHKEKYPEEPWPITEKESKEREIAARKRKLNQMLAAMEAESKRNEKAIAEEEKRKKNAVKDTTDAKQEAS